MNDNACTDKELEQIARMITDALIKALDSVATRPARIAYRIDEAAEVTGLTMDKIRGAINRGELRSKIIGKTCLISAESLNRLVR